MRVKDRMKRSSIAGVLACLADNVLVLPLTVGLVVGCVFVAISAPSWLHSLTRRDYPSLQSLPVYPNAEQVTHRSLTAEEAREIGNKVVTGTVLTFQSKDAPEVVLAYYRSLFHKEGWLSGGKDNSFLLPEMSDGATDTGSIEIVVSVERVSPSITNGKVILAISNGLAGGAERR